MMQCRWVCRLAECGKTYFFMKNPFAPCVETGFLPFRFAPRGLVSSLRLSAPLVFSSPPLGEITERESRVRKAFFRTLLVIMGERIRSQANRSARYAC